MFASGIPTAEKPVAQRFFLLSNGPSAQEGQEGAWSRYKEYLRSTSILLPIPPVLYRPLPGWLKRSLLLDFPIYQFREDKEGEAAIAEAMDSGEA